MRPRALSPAEVRRRFGVPLVPTGEVAGRFGSTKGADRQILADADGATVGAHFLVTEDVDDFAGVDLTSCGVSAVNPRPIPRCAADAGGVFARNHQTFTRSGPEASYAVCILVCRHQPGG